MVVKTEKISTGIYAVMLIFSRSCHCLNYFLLGHTSCHSWWNYALIFSASMPLNYHTVRENNLLEKKNQVLGEISAIRC